MIKMPCLFERDFADKRNPRLLETVTPGCEWVLAGEGTATRKYDGTACAVISGELFKRYDVKRLSAVVTGGGPTQWKDPPPGALACCDPDPVTGHWPHWVKVDPRLAEDRYHAQAWQQTLSNWEQRGQFKLARDRPGQIHAQMSHYHPPDDGTFELCGPKIGANAEGFPVHVFVRHGADELDDAPRTFAGLRDYLGDHLFEGIVFHHPDGRMCKIRRHDFGWPW